MSNELPESFMPHVAELQPEPLTPAVDANARLAAPVPVDAEQAKSVEAYFQRHRQADAVSGLLSLYTSAVLLTDLAAEHFDRPEEDDDEDQDKPQP